ncbi:MAG: phosphoribosylanthranilate isomerase [Chloroflexaceae bacterium]|nr:phosphoribosylanthranilate isomerase [Chloroflexaceae bacterium]
MRVKICGITQPEQGNKIAQLGATDLGFICVSKSPRYLQPYQIRAIIEELPLGVGKIGVFANEHPAEVVKVVKAARLTGVQLHGDESAAYCQQLRDLLPDIELIKAHRVKDVQCLAQLEHYLPRVDRLLLDAYHPQLLGGTGKTLDWQDLSQFDSQLPWFLAGGLTPDNIMEALKILRPDGIDLSSGVERSPGDKDLAKVARLFKNLQIFIA